MDKYIEHKTAFCGICGTMLIKQYPQKTTVEEYYCTKCKCIAYSLTYVYSVCN